MYNKISKFCSACLEPRSLTYIFLTIFTFTTIIFIGKYAFVKGTDNVLHYPEEEYQALEAEAQRIFEAKTFDTEYKFEINSYYSSSRNLSFTLHDENATSISVNITSFGLPNSKLSIDRATNHAISHFCINMLSLLLIPALIACIITIIILGIVSIVWFLSFFIHKMICSVRK